MTTPDVRYLDLLYKERGEIDDVLQRIWGSNPTSYSAALVYIEPDTRKQYPVIAGQDLKKGDVFTVKRGEADDYIAFRLNVKQPITRGVIHAIILDPVKAGKQLGRCYLSWTGPTMPLAFLHTLTYDHEVEL